VFSWLYIAKVGFSNVTASRFVHAGARAAVWPDPAVANIAYALSFIPLLVAAHLLVLGRTRPDLVGSNKSRLVMCGLVAITLAVVINPFGSARFIFGAVWLSLLAQLRIAKTWRAQRLLNLAIVVAFLFIFPLADKFSRPNASGKTFRALEVFQGNGDYDAFAQTNNAVNMVAQTGYSFGRQLIGALLFWVPRNLWSGKPDDTGIVIAEFMRYNFTNLSAPLVSELYVNGGFILVVVGFVGLGYVIRTSLHGVSESRSAAVCIVTCVVPFYLPIILRGSLLQATGFAGLFAFCVLVVKWASRAPRAAAQPDVPVQ